MDDRTRLFLCILATGGCFALLFALFGSVTGIVTRLDGRTGGTGLGWRVARAFGPLPPAVEGGLVGAVDGGLFGLLVGTVVGVVAGWNTPAELAVLRPVALVTGLLVALAVVFGLFAGLVAMIGVRAVLWLFVGGMGGAVTGLLTAGVPGLFVGVLVGAAGGVVVSRWARP